MRVVINASLRPGGEWGGVEQFVIGLISGLGRLKDGAEEYRIVVHPTAADWLDPYLGCNQQIVIAPQTRNEWFKRRLGPLRMSAGKLWRTTRHKILGTPLVSAPKSSGYFEAMGADVVHFPYQTYSFSNVPFIYNPHDLQHLHFPEFFKREDIATREAGWPLMCRYARAVATDARWVRDDVSARYGIAPEKIFAIPMGAPTELYGAITASSLDEVKARFHLSETFAFYPAQTWQHKNHLRLLDALATLREEAGITLSLVCTGRQNEHWPKIKARISALNLQSQVRFLGFVKPNDLRALYHLAQFIIHPSLFEGGGLPVLEAFHEGTPLACSNVTSLPEYAGEAALMFDPSSVGEIATAMRRMTTDSGLRAILRERGAVRVRTFTWERTARMYRALYRQVAGEPLSNEDRNWLAGA